MTDRSGSTRKQQLEARFIRNNAVSGCLFQSTGADFFEANHGCFLSNLRSTSHANCSASSVIRIGNCGAVNESTSSRHTLVLPMTEKLIVWMEADHGDQRRPNFNLSLVINGRKRTTADPNCTNFCDAINFVEFLYCCSVLDLDHSLSLSRRYISRQATPTIR
jgi:hypothetical protein